MLVEFKVGNFLSIKDVQTLPLLSTEKKYHNSAFIYGPNASGKSNLIRAMDYSRKRILNSQGIMHSNNVEPYVDPKGDVLDSPTYFEYIFDTNNHRYSYGFEENLTSHEIISEWLYLIQKGGDVCLFELKYDENCCYYIDDDIGAEFRIVNNRSFNDDLGAEFNYLRRTSDIPLLWRIANSEIHNATAQQLSLHYETNGIAICENILKWFEESLIIEMSDPPDGCIPVSRNIMPHLNNLLSTFDMGIAQIIEIPFSKKEIPVNLTKKMESTDDDQIIFIYGNSKKRYWLIHAIGPNNNRKYREMRLKHNGSHKARIDEESLGTARIIRLLTLYDSVKLRAKNDGCTLVVDEIECSIHVMIMNRLVELFMELSPLETQLIVTTHESRIFENKGVKRENIWFVDSDYSNDEKRSVLYPLSSFEIIKGKTDNLYFEGRYAAIPIFRTPNYEEE